MASKLIARSSSSSFSPVEFAGEEDDRKDSDEQERILQALERADTTTTVAPCSSDYHAREPSLLPPAVVHPFSRTQDHYNGGDPLSLERSGEVVHKEGFVSKNQKRMNSSSTAAAAVRAYQKRRSNLSSGGERRQRSPPTARKRRHSRSLRSSSVKGPKVRESLVTSSSSTTTPTTTTTTTTTTNVVRAKQESAPQKKKVMAYGPDARESRVGVDGRQTQQHVLTTQRVQTPSHSSKPVVASGTLQTKASSSLQENPSSLSKQSITPWIRQFLTSRPKDFLLPIPKDYLSDSFNLARLAPTVERVGMMMLSSSSSQGNPENAGGVLPSTDASSARSPSTLPPRGGGKNSAYPIYREALQLILQEEELVMENISPAVQRAAETLYCLVHARFAVSPRGLDVVRRRLTTTTSSSSSVSTTTRSSGGGDYRSLDPIFGRCPRMGCQGMPLLPYGDSNDVDFGGSSVAAAPPTCKAKRYCCRCGECFYSWESKVDGCAWGPSFCHLFLLTFHNELFPKGITEFSTTTTTTSSSSVLAPKQQPSRHLPPPQVFGFKLHPSVTLYTNSHD